MTVLAEIGKNARLLALLFEALQRALKVLVVMDYDFRQNLLPPFLATFVAGLGQTCKVRPHTGLGQAKLDCELPSGSGHPGGQVIFRPPSKWTCKWSTD